MYALDNLKSNNKHRVSFRVLALALPLTLCLTSSYTVATDKFNLGVPATEAQIDAWDIDIRPDGKGLPVGSSNAIDGEAPYVQKCAACHGEFAEGAGRYPALAGGMGSLDTQHPVKTVGSYWPYAATVFDYIRRAMPYGHAQSLTSDEVYGVTAYILYSSEVIEDDFVLDENTLAQVQMPNKDGFIKDTRPDTPPTSTCMKNCLSSAPIVIGKARQIDVTPEDETVAAVFVAESSNPKGEGVFAGQCMACHAVVKGENKFGPSLHNIVGQKVASVAGFGNYSAAIKSFDALWTEANLRQFLSEPQNFMPGTTMPYGGLQDASELESLIAYLKQIRRTND
jgi:cytochrome c2